jgi:CheY-like chemotaxis protein
MCHALIIEDEPIIAFHIADLVEEAGAKSVAFAQSELEALSAALDHTPDIIISDVRLLSGSGPAAVTSIRHRVGNVPAIFITGTPEALKGYDHDGVMEKPVVAARLKQEVTRIVMR